MDVLYSICIALSGGVLIGVIIGGFKAMFRKKTPSQKQIEVTQGFVSKLATILKYITLTLLAIGLLWCVYFLLLGILVPAQAEYANNMAELIVSVLTVISIIFAFVEFLRRK